MKWKQARKKKTRSRTLENREKPNLKLFIILKSPQFLKGPIFIAIGDKSYVTRYQMVASVNDLLLDWLIWTAVNFRRRSSPILFRFYRLSLPWCTLFSCIVGVFNNICCRSLKSAKRFSIANNSEKTNQIKRTRNKNRYDKKKREAKLDRTEKNQILNCS